MDREAIARIIGSFVVYDDHGGPDTEVLADRIAATHDAAYDALMGLADQILALTPPMTDSLKERLEAAASQLPAWWRKISVAGLMAEALARITTLEAERDRLRERVLAVEPALHEINNVADRIWNREVDGPSGANRILELIHAFAVPARAALNPSGVEGEAG